MARSIFMIARPVPGAPPLANITQDPLFKGWNATQLMSFSLGTENPTTIGSATGGAGAGKATFQETVITKAADMNSPVFLKYCAGGLHFDRITLYVTQPPTAVAPETVTQVYALGLVFITKISNDLTSGDDIVTETITMVYGQLQQRAIIFGPTGLRTGLVENTWDTTLNLPWTNAGTLDGPG